MALPKNPQTNNIIISHLTCCRCHHSWIPRQKDIRICPKCKSPYWDKPKKIKILMKGGELK